MREKVVSWNRHGASKSSRTKSRNVIIPREFGATPVFKETVDSHFVRALCAISATGGVLTAALIIKRETDHPDADEFTFIPNARRDTSSKAFVTRQIDMDFLRMRISTYSLRYRQRARDL
jgi:hypothetical protein